MGLKFFRKRIRLGQWAAFLACVQVGINSRRYSWWEGLSQIRQWPFQLLRCLLAKALCFFFFIEILFYLILFYFLAVQFSMWDLSSSTRDWTRAPCRGSTVLSTGLLGKSQPCDLYFPWSFELNWVLSFHYIRVIFFLFINVQLFNSVYIWGSRIVDEFYFLLYICFLNVLK